MGLDERIEYDLHTTNLLRSGRETLFLRQIVSMEYIFTIIRHSFYCNFNAIFGGWEWETVKPFCCHEYAWCVNAPASWFRRYPKPGLQLCSLLTQLWARAIGSHKSRINFPSVNGLHLSSTCIDGAANPISPFLVRPPSSVVLAFGIRVLLAKLPIRCH